MFYQQGDTTYDHQIDDDDAGLLSFYWGASTPNLVPALLSIGGTGQVQAGATYNLAIVSSSNDAIANADHTTIDWGDGSTPTVIQGNPPSASHPYTASPGVYQVKATGYNSSNAEIFHSNLHRVTVTAPDGVFATLDNAGPVDEGSSGTTVSFSEVDGVDPNSLTGFVYRYSINSTILITTILPTCTIPASYLADGPATVTVTGQVTDPYGRSTTVSTDIEVDNAAPTLTLSGPTAAEPNQTFALNLSSNDPGQDTISSTFVNWGDGTAETYQPGAPLDHVYAKAGTYTINAATTDEDGSYDVGVAHQVIVAKTGITLGAQNVTAALVNANEPTQGIMVSWTDASNEADMYSIYRETLSPSYSYVLAGTVDGSQRTFIDRSVSPFLTLQTRYMYYVVAFNAKCDGETATSETNIDEGYGGTYLGGLGFQTVMPSAAYVVSRDTTTQGYMPQWHNSTPTFVTLNQAFTAGQFAQSGYSIIGQTALGFDFASPIVNQPGPDLVVAQSQAIDNALLVSTNYDDYASKVSVSSFAANSFPSFPTNYYFGNSDGSGTVLPGTWSYNVFPFDLSSLGIPEGQAVSTIHLQGSTIFECAVAGIAALHPLSVDIIPYRTGDKFGETVSDSTKASGDPSQYVILVNNDSEENPTSGTPDNANNSAALPFQGGAPIDDDLARFTLKGLPLGITTGSISILPSDPSAVRLFTSDGTELPSSQFTVNLASPTGYLAGITTGDQDIWMEGLHSDSDFTFSLIFKDSNGNQVSTDSVHMTIADRLIKVDSNRDNTITFNDPDPTKIDQTTPANPYKFWLNDNIDHFNADGTDNSGQPDYDELDPNPTSKNPTPTLDFQTHKINNLRDTEDFAPLQILPPQSFDPNDPNWGISIRSFGPTLSLFRVTKNESEKYLTDQTVAQGLVNKTEDLYVSPLSVGVPTSWFVAGNQSFPTSFLFEGDRPGTGKVTVQFTYNGQLVADDSVDLKIEAAQKMYETWSIGNAWQTTNWSGDISTIASTPATLKNGYTPYTATSGETNDYILFVHGWRMQGWEKQYFANTAFKRLFWQGYKGRFGAFDWPTEWVDTSILRDQLV